jgi:chromosome segregation ATPase
MRANLLEATSQNSTKNHAELTNRVAVLEKDLGEARQFGRQWEFEAQKANDVAAEGKAEAEAAKQEAERLRRAVESLKLQTLESVRTRENFRVKLASVQEEMARAAQEVESETAGRAKKEAALLARQEVLDARLQAEARTRERLEKEIERLEAGEREGMRAVSESKKLAALVDTLREQLDGAETQVLKYKREFEEARESGLAEVKRTRTYMQSEIDAANHQVNIVREELEEQVLRLRADVDHVRLDADTARERHEMLLEEAVANKDKEIAKLTERHEEEIEDIQTQHDRALSNAVEDAQRAEQHLLERLSLSSAKTEHLQDRVAHLEEKLELSKQAAAAAVEAAKASKVQQAQAVASSQRRQGEPEKISPQALRESILVLQEQLQQREQVIEDLEQRLGAVDLEAPKTLAKRDEEIGWLRELLEVRAADLQDIVDAIGEEDYDAEALRGAAIRLKTSMDMEALVRERSAINVNLADVAKQVREAATPKVAQVVGQVGAAWGNWRRGSGATSRAGSPAPSVVGGFLSGLMSPAAPSAQQHQPLNLRRKESGGHSQPRRLTATRGQVGAPSVRASPRREMLKGKMRAQEGRAHAPPMLRTFSTESSGTVNGTAAAPLRSLDAEPAPGGNADEAEEEEEEPRTPTMLLRRSEYDADARAEDYSDAGFYDEASTVDDEFGAEIGRLP